MAVYLDGFSNWADVVSNFEIKGDDAAEPDEVLFAEYDLSQAYEGSAIVVYRRGDKYFAAHGSHCSCYGLEGQWQPDVYETRELLDACVAREWWGDRYKAVSSTTQLP